MSVPDRLRLTLELEVGSDPIVGALIAGERRLEFAGWVGLASALEQTMRPAGDVQRGRRSRGEAASEGVSQAP